MNLVAIPDQGRRDARDAKRRPYTSKGNVRSKVKGKVKGKIKGANESGRHSRPKTSGREKREKATLHTAKATATANAKATAQRPILFGRVCGVVPRGRPNCRRAELVLPVQSE